MAAWWAGDKTERDAGSELNELRRAVAEMLDTDVDTWPEHGNAPLAIAAALARQRQITKEREAERDAAVASVAALREGLERLVHVTCWCEGCTNGYPLDIDPNEETSAAHTLLAQPNPGAALMAVVEAAERVVARTDWSGMDGDPDDPEWAEEYNERQDLWIPLYDALRQYRGEQ